MCWGHVPLPAHQHFLTTPYSSSMEKFSNWRDKGTGISPFMPVENPQLPIKKYLFNPVIVAVKLPLLYILYAFTLVAPKPLFLFILRHIFGVSDIDLLVEGIRKLKTAEIDRRRPGSNHLVVANFISPIDVLILYVLSAVSSINSVVVLLPRGTKLHALDFWQFTKVPFLEPDAPLPGEVLTDYAFLKDKLVILFPEGTPSNNKAVLPFSRSIDPKLLQLPGFSFLTIVLRVYPNLVTLPVPNVTGFQYLCKLLTVGKVFIKAKIVPHVELTVFSIKAAREVFPDNSLSLVGDDMTVEQKTKFFSYYKGYALSQVTSK